MNFLTQALRSDNMNFLNLTQLNSCNWKFNLEAQIVCMGGCNLLKVYNLEIAV